MALGIITGCNRQKRDNNLPLISQFVVDSVYMPIALSDHFKLRVKEVQSRSATDEIVFFVKNNNYSAYFYNMSNSRRVGDTFSLVKYANEYKDSYPLGIDSFMVELEKQLLVISKNRIKKWDVSPITRQISPFAFVGYLSMESMHVFGDTVACITSTEETQEKIGPNAPFLKANYDILIKLLPDTAILLAKHSPNPPYFYKQDYNCNPERVYMNSRQIVYCYSYSDTLVMVNPFNQTEKRVRLRTSYFSPNVPFDYSRESDFKYIDSFYLEQSMMTHLFYDKARHRIYVFLKHKGKHIEESGKKNEMEDLPHSLFVLDEQLHQLKEIYIPPGRFGPVYRAFVTHKGLYLPAARPQQKNYDKTLFYRIVIP